MSKFTSIIARYSCTSTVFHVKMSSTSLQTYHICDNSDFETILAFCTATVRFLEWTSAPANYSKGVLQLLKSSICRWTPVSDMYLAQPDVQLKPLPLVLEPQILLARSFVKIISYIHLAEWVKLFHFLQIQRSLFWNLEDLWTLFQIQIHAVFSQFPPTSGQLWGFVISFTTYYLFYVQSQLAFCVWWPFL